MVSCAIHPCRIYPKRGMPTRGNPYTNIFWLSFIASLFLVFAFCAFAPAAGRGYEPEGFEGVDHAQNITDDALDAIVQSAMEDSGGVGVSLSVVEGGAVRFVKGYGYADIESETIVDPYRHLFRIGSVTKTFTFTAIMQLVEQGLIDLDADVNDYLTAFKIAEHPGGPVRIKDLLTHRSGFDIVLRDLFVGEPAEFYSLEDWLEGNIPKRVRPAGVISNYDNYGAALAGYIVQEVSGEAYEDYIKRHIFTPLKMSGATARQILGPENAMSMPPELADRVVSVYQWNGSSHARQSFELVVGAPAGSISATSADMARYMLAHLNNGELEGERILDEETARLMKQRPYPGRPSTDYAHGFRSRNIAGFDTFEHDGATFTTFSSMVMIPELDLGVFVSVTGSRQSATDIARGILAELIDERAKPAPQGIPLENPEAFTGRYLTSRRSHRTSMKILTYFGGRSDVTASDHDTLLVNRDGNEAEYRRIGERSFQRVDGDALISFEMDSSGRALRYYNDKGHEAMERMPIDSSSFALKLVFCLAVFASLAQLIFSFARRALSLPRKGSGNNIELVATLTSIVSISSVSLFFWVIHDIAGAGNAILYIWPTVSALFLRACILLLIGLLLALAFCVAASFVKTLRPALQAWLIALYFSVQSCLVFFWGAWNLVGVQA